MVDPYRDTSCASRKERKTRQSYSSLPRTKTSRKKERDEPLDTISRKCLLDDIERPGIRTRRGGLQPYLGEIERVAYIVLSVRKK